MAAQKAAVVTPRWVKIQPTKWVSFTPSLTAAPYSFTWAAVPPGSYSLTARATDNNGASVTSSAVNLTVNSAIAKLHFIQVDHLNTPRAVYDDQKRLKWKWDQQEPFGVTVPDENPSGLGAFEFPMRFPGQYADKETNLVYNQMRTYDPVLGRYAESDPIGLTGGLNTYLYGSGDSLRYIDPRGEAVEVLVAGGVVLLVGAAIITSSPAGRNAAKSIAQKIADVCKPNTKDPCDQQQEEEEQECWDNYGGVFGAGHFSYRGCMERARIRGDLCRRGLPQPPKWGDPDVTGEPRPPRRPR